MNLEKTWKQCKSRLTTQIIQKFMLHMFKKKSRNCERVVAVDAYQNRRRKITGSICFSQINFALTKSICKDKHMIFRVYYKHMPAKITKKTIDATISSSLIIFTVQIRNVKRRKERTKILIKMWRDKYIFLHSLIYSQSAHLVNIIAWVYEVKNIRTEKLMLSASCFMWKGGKTWAALSVHWRFTSSIARKWSK